MGLLHLLFGFHGRLNRTGYWLGVVTTLVFFAATYVLIGWLAGGAAATWSGVFATPLGGLLFFIAAGAGIWSCLALHVKRWHDRDKTWLWIMMILVPVLGPIWALVECGFLPGTAGPNAFDHTVSDL